MQKNLNDIIPPSRRRQMGVDGMNPAPRPSAPPMQDMPPAMPPSQPPPRPPMPPMAPVSPRAPRGPRRFPVVTAAIAVLVIIASVAALFFFSGAKVAVNPTKNPVSVAATLKATLGQGEVPFELISVEKTANNSIPAESTENVTQAAQGPIVVSNSQDAAQPLIKNTRFETPEGLVYRIRDSITVPAAKNGQPGTLTVTVYADEAGERYNIDPSSFTLPGLKGTDTFTKVTARSTDGIKGGFAGARPTVSEATKEAEMEKLQITLDADLLTALKTQVRPGYVLIPGATAATYEEQPDTAGAGNTVEIATKGTIRGVIIPEEALARAVAYQSVGTYTGQPLMFDSIDTLALAPAEGLIPVTGENEFSFTLTGNTTLVWKVDTAKVAAAVAGKNRDAAEVALEALQEVDGALLVLKPFWRSSFPADPAKIDVVVDGVEPAS